MIVANGRVLLVLLCVLVTLNLSALRCQADPPSARLRSDWQKSVSDLGSDRYSERDAATKRLAEAGADVLPLIVAAVGDPDPEVCHRAAFVLRLMSRSQDAGTHQAARQSLRTLARSEDLSAARAAQRVLRSFEEQAAQSLQMRGARLQWNKQGQVLSVDLARCRIDDDDLRPLSELQLRQLNLSYTSVTDAAMLHLHDQTQLELLNLKSTNVTDDGLRHLAGLQNLRTLSVERTRVTDAGLAHLAMLRQLGTLYLGESRVRGPGLDHLCGLPINYLSFQRSPVDDSVTKHLVGLANLRTVGLDETNVTDDCIPPLAELKSLEVLWLNKTKVTDKCVADLLRLENLTTLHARDTKISSQGLAQLEAAFGPMPKHSSPGLPPSNRR